MRNILNQNRNCVDLAFKILSWLVIARRTLTVDEVRTAVSIRLNKYEPDELNLPDTTTMLDVCASLVTIDGRSNTIRLAHYTVQEYLIKSSIFPKFTDLKFAMACATYLSFNAFAQGVCMSYDSLEARTQSYPFLDYAARYLPSHLRSCDEEFPTDVVLKFLGSPGSIASCLQVVHFHQGLWNSHNAYPKGYAPIHLASEIGHQMTVQWLLDHGAEISAQDEAKQTALHKAASEGHEAVIRLLLERGDDISTRDITGTIPLLLAAYRGHEAAVELLLEKGSDISASGFDERTALHVAAARGNEAVVRVLLEKGAEISDKYHFTRRHREATKRLCDCL
jgi:hypothetical protein